MNSIRTHILSLAAGALLLTGCGFLDVNPKGETFDADMFSSGEGYEDALYGVYAELSSDQYLFGSYFSLVPEVMSGNALASDYRLGNMALADWTTTGPNTIRRSMWSNAYKAINHLNNIITHAREGGEDEFRYSRLYLGEALALRALVHYELLSFFGAPNWASESEKAKAIPYVTQYAFTITPFSSLDEAYQLIIDDLVEAESLLAEDEELIPAVRTNSATGFTDARITHMNLYAVDALLARVYWQWDKLDYAALYAMKVIESGKFSFRPRSAFVQPDNGSLDFNETIFGFYVGSASQNYMTRTVSAYRLNGVSSTSSVTLATDWKSLYDDGSASSGSDYRLNAWFDDGSETLVKLVNDFYYVNYSSTSTYSGSSIIGCNVFRLPEMYYIMAEYYMNLGNQDEARSYFDAVTTSRGLDPYMGHAVTLTQDRLFRERRKEMYGEGFTWLEMKKANTVRTPASGVTLSGSASYTLPIPDEETDGRNNIED